MKEVALMTDPSSEDAQHPVWTERVSFEMGSNTSKFYNHNPILDSINPSDCVDMDCDGLKKILIRDIDGSFTGSQGLASLISRSEYEWDGDRRRGLGDYRIPIAMLSRADGSRIDVNSIYPNKGIYRGTNGSCQWMTEWNTYHCSDIDYMMLIIESLDADTEVRRLSPIGVGAAKYIDLINGPQDHGWCGGYTCQERISTFYSIVSTGLNYTIGLTSTNPQRTNFILLNANDSQSLVIAYIYNNPQRLDVYIGSEYIIPTNGYMKDGNLRYRRGIDFIPSPSTDPHGTNYYDRSEKKLYIVIRGDRAVRVETTPVIQLGIDLPPITIDEFFEVNLVRNLALLLGISPNRIRIVNVIFESGTRQKRETSPRTRVELEIGDAPSNETTLTEGGSNNNTTPVYNMTTTTGPTEQEMETYNELINITTKVSEVIQTGELSKEIGYNVLDAELTEPKPIVTDPTRGVRASNVTGGPQPGDNGTENLTTVSKKQFEMEQEERNSTVPIELNIPTRLVLVSVPSQAMEGVPLGENGLRVAMHDGSSTIVTTLGIGLPWELTVSIVSSTSSDSFLINPTTSIGNGLATFNDLMFSHSGVYKIMFQVSRPSSANFTLTAPITVLPRSLSLYIFTQPPSQGNTTFPLPSSVIVHVLDTSTKSLVTNLGWRGRTWYMSASFITGGQVWGQSLNTTVVGGVAQFSSMHITEPGSYTMRLSAYTSGNDIMEHLPNPINSNVIEITKYPLTRIIIIFSNSYSDIVSGRKGEFISTITSELQSKYTNVHIYNVSVTEGSIIVSFFATSTDVNALSTLVQDIPTSPTLNQFTFNNVQLSLVSVKQDPNYPIVLPTEPAIKKPNHYLLIIIVCGSVSGVLLLCILLIMAMICCNCCCKRSNRSRKRYSAKEVRNNGRSKKDNLYTATTVHGIIPVLDEKSDKCSTYLRSVEGGQSFNSPPIEYTELNEISSFKGKKENGNSVTRFGAKEEN